jgi:hypothetical protein
MQILSLEFAVQVESPGPNYQLCVPLYSNYLDPLVPSNWFPYTNAARTSVTENMSRDRYTLLRCDVIAHAQPAWTQRKHYCCIVDRVCCGRCLAMDLYITIVMSVHTFHHTILTSQSVIFHHLGQYFAILVVSPLPLLTDIYLNKIISL